MLFTISEKTVGEIAAQSPSSIRVFESLGIDYCCGGKRPLSEACARIGISLDRVNQLLANAERDSRRQDTEGWADAPLSALIDHIVAKHHSFVRRETPRLQALLQKVINKHGVNNPQLAEVQRLFTAVTEELTTHLLKEEQILFPLVQSAAFGSVAKPIANMLAEHDDAGALVAQIRELTNGYAPPANACLSFRALYQGLHEFETDLHRHVHLENNVLFPRALALDRARELKNPTWL